MNKVRLETPQHGWSKLHMGSWSGRLSYVDDPAFDLLWAVERALRTKQPSAVRFDAEGHEYIIIFDWYDQFVITDRDTPALTWIDMKLKDVAAALVRDIRKDLDLWAAFPAGAEDSQFELEDRKIDLGILLSVVEKRL